MLPQAVFTEAVMRRLGLDPDLIHDRKYGWILDETLHQDLQRGRVKWNDEWQRWLNAERRAGRRPQIAQIEDQLKRMLRDNRWNGIYKTGVRPPKGLAKYSQWGRYASDLKRPIEEKIMKLINRRLAETAARQSARQGVKSVPWVGWGAAVIFFACDMRNPTVTFGEALQSNIPYYGVAYDAYRVYEQIRDANAMINAETTSTIYENGDRTIPSELL
jgi:hypothetical protein